MAGPLVVAGVAGLLLAEHSQPPIASFDDLGKAISACVRSDDPAAGSELELRFTLTARGTIVGKPTIVLARTVAPIAAQRALVSTFLDALRRCTPFRLTASFAQAVAGRPVTLHVRTGGPAIVV